jgi:hypothetical protein
VTHPVVDRGHLALGAILCAVTALALAGWLRTQDPPRPDRVAIEADTAAGVRLFYELQGFTLDYMKVDRVVDGNAYVTLRVAGFMPAAARFRVPVAQGWRVLDVVPLRTQVLGP